MTKILYSTDVCKKTGISRDTLRHYLDQGLLHPRRNPHNGYRQYTADDIVVLTFILRAKRLGFTLKEISAMRHAITQNPCPHKSVLPALEKNLDHIKQKIADLRIMEKHISSLIQDFSTRDCTKKPSAFSLTPRRRS